jgi:hypothetical protein
VLPGAPTGDGGTSASPDGASTSGSADAAIGLDAATSLPDEGAVIDFGIAE